MARGSVVRGQRVKGLVLHGTGAGASGQQFRADVGRFVTQLPSRMRAVMIGAALLYAEAVIVGNAYSTGTPVGTGYARGSWVASVGTRSNALPLGARPTEGAPRKYAPRFDQVARVINTWDPLAGPLWLQNNTSYLVYLEFGLTIPLNPATPAGWVGIADRQWPTMVATVTRSLRNEVRRVSALNYFADPARAVPARDRV